MQSSYKEKSAQKKLGCPRQYFITNLERFIVSLIEGSNKIILAVDANEHAKNSKLARELKSIRLVNSHAKKFNK